MVAPVASLTDDPVASLTAEQARATARDPASPPELLARLATHHRGEESTSDNEEILRLVAANPATPVETLFGLAYTCAEEVFDNPAMELHLLADPGLLTHERHWKQVAYLARSEALVPRYESRLAEHPASLVLGGLAVNRATSPAMLARLEARGGHEILYGLARNPAAGAALLRRLATGEDPDVRKVAATHRETPADLLALLRRAGAHHALGRMETSLPPLAPEDRTALLAEGPFARALLAARPDLSPEEFAQLCPEGDLSRTPLCVRLALAANPALRSPSHLERFARDPDEQTRRQVASLPDLSPELALLLVEDPSRMVRAELAWNASVPPPLLARLARDSEALVREKAAGNASIPASLLETLAADPEAFVRKAAGRNVGAPVGLVERLAAADPEEEVREAMALVLRRRGEAKAD